MFNFDGISSENFGIKTKKVTKSLFPEIRDQFVDLPGVHGSYLFPQKFGDRYITIDCTLIDADENTVVSLAKWLWSSEYKRLILPDDPTRYWLAKINDKIDIDKTFRTRDFTLSFRAKSFRYAISPKVITRVMTSGQVVEIQNEGNVDAETIVKIKAKYGNIEKPMIQVNDLVFFYDGIVTSGSTLTVTSTMNAVISQSYDVNVTGAYDPLFDNVPGLIKGDFPVLLSEQNTLKYSSLNGAQAEIEVIYTERWM